MRDARQLDRELLRQVAARHAYPLLFATVSGAHLYGFPSPDSDVDLRGAHVLPPRELLGLDPGPATVQSMRDETGLELDLVTHDVGKFFGLLLKKNGYVLEQLCSPLVVATTPEHEELVALVPDLVTRHHAHHYLGFLRSQWRLLEREPRVKPLLYCYRVLLTGIHLMRSGEVEADLTALAEQYRLGHLDELIEEKRRGAEEQLLPERDLEVHREWRERLEARLVEERDRSRLPEVPSARPALDDLLLRVRLGGSGSHGGDVHGA